MSDDDASEMRIAYLVFCHRDPEHIARLAAKLTNGDPQCTVLIHVDRRSAMAEPLAAMLRDNPRAVMAQGRIDVYWGGFSLVQAVYVLLHEAGRLGGFDRYVVVEGADYPLMSPAAIRRAFLREPTREFLRGCDLTVARDRGVRGRARYPFFADRPTRLKRVVNRLIRRLNLTLRAGTVNVDGRAWHVYYGSAMIAFTREMREVFLRYETHPALTRYFRHSLSPDELFFHTIAFNSHLRGNITGGGVPVAEFAGIDLVDLQSVCYFEYPDAITVFEEADFERLRRTGFMLIRKVETGRSTALLDRIDALHAEEDDGRA